MKRELSTGSGAVADGNTAAMLLHDAVANGEAEAGGISAAAKPWLKDVVNLFRADAAAGIGEFGDDLIAAFRAARRTF